MGELIPGYPKGSDITILETMYIYPQRDEDGVYTKDILIIVFKDNVTNKHGHAIIKEPNYTFYTTKEGEMIPDHPLFFVEKNKVKAITCKYRDIDKEVAKIIGQENLYKANIANRERGENRKLHKDPRLFRSDWNIEDHYRFLFYQNYTNNIGPISKAFFDIEVDSINMAGDFVQLGECPVNMISLHDEAHDITISFILRNYDNPQIQEFEDEYVSGKFNENDIKEFVKENVGGWKQNIRLGLENTKYKLLFFDDELDLITTFFQMVHHLEPDFIEGWNSSAFDLEYLIHRIYALNAVPADVMTDPNFEIKYVKNYVDQKNLNEFAERGDYTQISGHTVWLDQMIQYASRRKAKIGSFKSFKLDDIGKQVAGVRKLNYHNITNNIAELPYKSFKTFVLYNIMDVVVQKCIEVRSQDIDYLFSKALQNCVTYKKAHRQSVYLINRMGMEFDDDGFILGNNVNKWNPAPKEKFLGALVGDPLKTNDYSKMKIGDKSIMLVENCDDYDYKSLYPSIILEFDIAPNTQIGRIEIPNKVYKNENVYNNPKYSRGGEFIENYMTDNIIEFCKRWFNMTGIMDFLLDLEELRSSYKFGAPYLVYRNDGNKVVFSPVYDIKSGKIPALVDNPSRSPIYFFGNMKENNIESDYYKIIDKNKEKT